MNAKSVLFIIMYRCRGECHSAPILLRYYNIKNTYPKFVLDFLFDGANCVSLREKD